jgi:hypothetical protein
MDNQNRSLI